MSDSIRDALTKAYAAAPDDSHKFSDPVGVGADPVEASPSDTPAVVPGKIDGDEKPAKSEQAKSAPASGPAPEQGSPPSKAPDPAPVAPVASDPAPASWKAEAKAHWDKLPAEARAEVKRREVDMQRAFSTTAEARKFREDFGRVTAQYEPLLKKFNVTDPVREVVAPMLEFRNVLEHGTGQQKALAVMNMIKGFDIDVAELDRMLVEGPGVIQQAPQAPAFDPRAVPELQPLFHIAEQMQARQVAAVEAAVAKAETLPHFEEVREDVADIMEAFAKRGREISIEDAHKRALAMHPDLAPAPVPAQPTVSEAAAILAKSRAAASTVAGAPRAAPGQAPTTLREQIAAAMEERG